MAKTLYITSLGCEKNRIDTENIMHTLSNAGYIFVSDPKNADYLVINTCAFIEAAKKESINAILDLSDNKANTNKKLIVLGCLAERYGKELSESMPEVDVFVGVNSYHDIVNIIEREESRVVINPQFVPYEKGRLATTLQSYAYIKIAEGCDNHCTYCAIPSIRGRYRSERMEYLVQEAERLKDMGINELIIVAQDITRYGIDLYGTYKLKELIKSFIELKFSKIRLMYAYPELIDDELIEMIATTPQIAKYIDVPLQHISDRILKLMNRKTSEMASRALIEKIKNASSKIVIRSTFIVGFPGEEEKDFQLLLNFIKSGMIDYAGFFEYSKEEGTRAATMPGMLPKTIRHKRAIQLSKEQSQVIVSKHREYLNQTIIVMYEGIDYKKGLFFGRNDYNAPDIDTLVYFTSDIPLDIGEFYFVKITKTDFHLYGNVLGIIGVY
ncbi:MAG: 30S ribosomal protein S12 methylthiotransferase RimO [Christensenellaceae bacterium]|jgi:ribosomal protein S12 methylthiotransferase|nr:30S ribosomal protein S12 methylthiotransferase RimO [Christensenellaceae bacterium]